MADHDDEFIDEGAFSNNEVVHSNSISMDDEEANSRSDDSCKIGTTTIGINQEVTLEIDHEDLYADITFSP